MNSLHPLIYRQSGTPCHPVAALRAPLAQVLWASLFVVLAASISRDFVIHELGEGTILGPLIWLHIGSEGSLSAWWTSLLWSYAALGCLLIFVFDLSRWRTYWAALSLGSLLLSADETVQLHEQFALLAGRVVGSASGAWATGWVIAAVPIVAVCIVLLTPFLLHLQRRTAGRLALSGAVFLVGAVGMEMLFGAAVTEWGASTATIFAMIYIEECLEMAGVTLFLLTLCDEWIASFRDPAESSE
jgi:hypothetical protein